MATSSFASFPSRYLNLPGLNEVAREIFSQNYFVVINDSKIKSFAQLYEENRTDNVSSFVTADSVAHPLFALQNNIRLKVIEKYLCSSLRVIVNFNDSQYRDRLPKQR